MESKRVVRRSAVVVFLMVGILLAEAEASPYGECYKGCLVVCTIQKKTKSYVCPFVCITQCLKPSHALNLGFNDALSFCELGCATSRCAELMSIENPNEEKVAKCVDSCNETCTKTI